MTDIKRRRKRPAADGMTSTGGISDQMTRLVIDELQERIRALSIPAAATPAGDDDKWRYARATETEALRNRCDALLQGQADAVLTAEALERAINALHTETISNTLGETIPAYSVVRITAYDPDKRVYTVGKPEGPGSDRTELLLFTSHSEIEDDAYGLAYRPSERLVKVAYDAPDASFEPTAGKGYTTQAASWRLLGLAASDAFAFFAGMGSVSEEWDTSEGLTWIRAYDSGIPPLMKTVTAAVAGEIDARQVDETFTVTGITRTFLTE